MDSDSYVISWDGVYNFTSDFERRIIFSVEFNFNEISLDSLIHCRFCTIDVLRETMDVLNGAVVIN